MLLGLAGVVQPLNILAGIAGILIGIVVGVIPGVGPSMSIAILVPFTFGMDPATGMILLVGIYAGSVYGGSITSILLGIPGEPVSIPTMWEGHPMAKKGYGMRALRLAVTASTIGGTLSALALLFFAPLVATIAISFGPPEYVALTVLGLAVIVSLESASLVRGAAITFAGLLVGTVGLDPALGMSRFTLGNYNMYEGFAVVALLIGLFALPELVNMVSGSTAPRALEATGKGLKGFSHLRRLAKPIARGSGIGMLVGALPGAGGTVATFIAYDDAKRRAKHPELFGKGSEEGLVAAESCNNGSVQTALVPLLTLGIPGSAAAAVFLGALTIHGLQPGPLLFEQEGQIIYTFLLGALLVQLWLYLAGRFGAPFFARVARIDRRVLAPTIVVFTVLGAYALRNNFFDVWTMLAFGLVGVFMERHRLSRAAFVLAVILGPLLEANLTRSLSMSGGDPLILVQRPVALIVYAVMLFTIGRSILMLMRRRRREALEPLKVDKVAQR